MRTLEEIIEKNEEILESKEVENTGYNLMEYAHGRCQIFAQALHEELGYEMEFLWDTDYWFEGDEMPTVVLVHAYCILPKGVPFKGKYVDARGILSERMIDREYECNEKYYEKTTLERLQKLYKNKTLEKPTKKELENIKKYIRKNIKEYKRTE